MDGLRNYIETLEQIQENKAVHKLMWEKLQLKRPHRPRHIRLEETDGVAQPLAGRRAWLVEKLSQE